MGRRVALVILDGGAGGLDLGARGWSICLARGAEGGLWTARHTAPRVVIWICPTGDYISAVHALTGGPAERNTAVVILVPRETRAERDAAYKAGAVFFGLWQGSMSAPTLERLIERADDLASLACLASSPLAPEVA